MAIRRQHHPPAGQLFRTAAQSQRHRLTVVAVMSGTKASGHSSEQAKARKAIAVPLNAGAVLIVRRQTERCPTHVFSLRRQPIRRVSTKLGTTRSSAPASKTSAGTTCGTSGPHGTSWPGTPIAELQELGAWKSELMVKRYAHFAPEQLRTAANRLGTFLGTPWVRGKRGSAHNVFVKSQD